MDGRARLRIAQSNQKLKKLKENIDQKYVKETLEKLKKKTENKNLTFALKIVIKKKKKLMDSRIDQLKIIIILEVIE